MIYSYWDSLIFDVNHRTIWHQGMPFGNVYPGTLSYGEIFNDLQNNIALGAYSHAEGYQTKANGNNSHAEGNNTLVDGNNSHAEGYKSQVTSDNAHAEGNTTKAIGENSHAEGINSEAQGRNSHAEGFISFAIGEDSHAEGNNTFAKAKGSHSEGNITKVEPEAENGHAEGYNTIVSAKNAHAEGNTTKVENTGENSHVEGLNTIARAKNSHAEGNSTIVAGENSHAEGYNSKATSTNSHAEGSYTTAAGENSHAEGAETSVYSPYAHAEGNNNIINTLSDSSHIEGSNNKISFSKSSHIEGDSNVNGGNIGVITNSHYSHVEGLNNYNYSINSHVEGKDTYNFGKESHIEGVGHLTYAYTSHIEGYTNTIGKSIGDTKYVHVGGNNNTVYPNSENNVIYGSWNWVKGIYSDINGKNISSYANYSVLRGSLLEINSKEIENNQNGIDFINVSGNNINVGENANYGFAHGFNITLQSPYEVGFGRYTKSYLEGQNQDKQNTIFMIGNGISLDNKSNALDVRENGISYLYKGIYTWDYVEDYPYSTVANNESSYCITRRQLAQVATVTYVMRNSAGRRNFYPLDNPTHPETANPRFIGAEYFNNYGDENNAPNNAYANFCHAEGWGTYCHTGGTYSHAEGCGTETRNPGEHASGNWNKSSDNTLFSVGWGTNNIDRSNAFEIKRAPTSDGIAFIDKKPIVTSILNGTGPTYMWKGYYADYIKIKQVDPNTLYFIYDGDASTRNDFISIDQMDDIVNRKVEEKIKQYTQGILYNANYSPKFNGHGGDSKFSYVWSGDTTEFAGLGDDLSNDPNTVFIIRNNK